MIRQLSLSGGVGCMANTSAVWKSGVHPACSALFRPYSTVWMYSTYIVTVSICIPTIPARDTSCRPVFRVYSMGRRGQERREHQEGCVPFLHQHGVRVLRLPCLDLLRGIAEDVLYSLYCRMHEGHSKQIKVLLYFDDMDHYRIGPCDSGRKVLFLTRGL